MQDQVFNLNFMQLWRLEYQTFRKDPQNIFPITKKLETFDKNSYILSEDLQNWLIHSPKTISLQLKLNDSSKYSKEYQFWNSDGTFSLPHFYKALENGESIANISEKDEQWKKVIDRFVYLICVLENTCTIDWKNSHLFSKENHHSTISLSEPISDTISVNRSIGRNDQERIFFQEVDYVWKLSIESWMDNNDPLFSFSLMIPYFERILQQIVYAHKKYNEKSKNIVIPKLSELSKDKTFINLFGEQFSTIISMMVKLQGLSIRNAILHGYISSNGWYFGYTLFLLSLTKTLVVNYMISSITNSIINDSLTHKEKVLFDRPFDVDYQNDNSLETFSTMDKLFLQFKEEDLKDIQLILQSTDSCDHLKQSNVIMLNEAFKQSLFVYPNSSYEWLLAIRDYSKGNIYSSIIRIIPLIEAGLRRVYSHENNNPDSFLVASGDSLLVTSDITLSSTIIFDNDKVINKLINYLGILYQNALFDIFKWDRCIKYRDVICHGGCLPSSISRSIASYFIYLGLALCSYFHPTTNHMDQNIYFMKARDYFENIYIPLYHPMSILDRSNELPDFQIIQKASNIFYSSYLDKINTENEVIKVIDSLSKLLSSSWTNLKEICSSLNSYLETHFEFIKSTKVWNQYDSSHRIQLHQTNLYGVNLSESMFKSINRMTEIYKQINDTYKKFEHNFSEYSKLIISKKIAQKKIEACIGLLIMYRPIDTFLRFTYFNLKYFHHIILQESIPEKEISNILTEMYNTIGSISSQIQNNKIQHALEIIIAFSIDPLSIGVILPKFSFKLLNKRSVMLHSELIKKYFFPPMTI